MNREMRFIHYGSNRFDIDKFVPVQNRALCNKPIGGLWASPMETDFGWKEWCEGENFETDRLNESFTFSLLDDAKIVEIHQKEDVEALPMHIEEEHKRFAVDSVLKPIDFERLRKDGIDAILFYLSSDRRLYWAMYGWDCDCILVMNPDVIIADEPADLASET